MAHALITGGTGFVGSNLALRLVERGWRVTILQRAGAGAFDGIEVLFHAAGVVDYWNQGVEQMVQVNVQGTRNVIEAALQTLRRTGSSLQRVVHISSTAAMGIHPNQVVDESFTFNVKPERFIYGHSKFEAEQAVFAAVREGLPAVIVNPTTVIGPRDVRKVSSGMVVEVAKHCVPPLIPPGGINVVPICDAAQGAIEAAEKGQIGERYILAGENITHLQLYSTIANVVGCGMKLKAMPRWQVALIAGLTDMLQPPTRGPVPLTGDRLRLESQMFYFDGSKARNQFKMPSTPLRVTIGRTFEWYEMMGEFEGILDQIEKDGVCKYCGRTRYCTWPPPPAIRADEVKSGVRR